MFPKLQCWHSSTAHDLSHAGVRPEELLWIQTGFSKGMISSANKIIKDFHWHQTGWNCALQPGLEPHGVFLSVRWLQMQVMNSGQSYTQFMPI